MTDQGYTKHYYIEGQRIASKIGSGFAGMEGVSTISTGLTPLSGDLSSLPEQIWNEKLGADFYCVDLDINGFNGEPELAAMADLLNSGEGREEDLYYYHGDHLGSSSYITDASSFPTQHLQYLPFGEDFIHQQNSTGYYSPYTFSAKERDFETSYSYFGARYYDADLSIWLSVDPMSDNAPSWTPYRYAFNNPVMYIDPSGLFENKAAAKEYAKQNNIKTGLLRANQIVKNKDGSWSINNRSSYSSISNLGAGLGVRVSGLIEKRGLHLRDIGIFGYVSLTDPFSESFNPNAVLQNDWLDRAYYFGYMFGFVSPTGRVATAANSTRNGANLSTKGINLSKQLASEAQMGETGITIIGPGKLKEATRLSQQYGGNVTEWVKKTSHPFSKNGTTFETHWYENTTSGARVEFKTKFP